MSKLQRFTESVVLPNSFYKNVTDTAPSSIRESVKSVGKTTRINESVDKEKILQVLKEAKIDEETTKKVEAHLKESASSSPKIWRVPVARFDNLNANKRRYTESLWRNVMDNQQDAWKGLCGLADHPFDDNDPGSFKDSSVVWLGMDIDTLEKIVYGYCVFVGTFGHLAQEIIEAGGRVGFSSSGFGELMNDGITVNPDTYQIERLADVVLNPSQSVYGTAENESNSLNIEYTKKEPISKDDMLTESTINNQPETSTNIAPKSAILSNKETQKETLMENTTSTAFSKAEAKLLRNHINSLLQESENIENPLKKLSELNEILTIIKEGKLPDLEEGVLSKLEEVRSTIEKDVNDAHEMKEALGSSDLKEITEKTAKVMENGVLMAEQIVDYKTLCQGLEERNKELSKKLKSMELKQKIKESRLEKDTLRKNEREVTHQMTLDALQEEIEDLRAESKNASRVFEAKLERYKKGNARLEKMNSTLESKLKEATTKLARLEKIREGSAVSNEKTNKELASLKEENATLKSMVTRLQERNKTLREKVDEAVRMANETEEKLVEATTPNFHVQPAFTERVSKYLNFRENNGVQIESYWADLYSRYGESITPFERQIRDAKTLREAQHAFMKIMPQVDKNLKAVQEASFMESDATHHMEQLKESGMKIDELNTLDAVNAAAKARMEAFGLE